MTLWVNILIGLAVGVHGASYGAYKDAPHENFILSRVFRELVLAVLFGSGLVLLQLSSRQSLFIIYTATFGGVRIMTEFWKLFVRNVPKGDFRIPSRFHFVKKGVINNPFIRIFVGILFIGALIGIWALSTLAPHHSSVAVRGMIVGFIIGMAEGIGGAYKDGAIEGFYWHKFIKSPVCGALGGLIVSGHMSNFVPGYRADLPVVMFAIFGTYRMLLELAFKMVVPNYAPGKFPSMIGAFTEWTEKRAAYFLPPYMATWALYLVLATHPGW